MLGGRARLGPSSPGLFLLESVTPYEYTQSKQAAFKRLVLQVFFAPKIAVSAKIEEMKLKDNRNPPHHEIS